MAVNDVNTPRVRGEDPQIFAACGETTPLNSAANHNHRQKQRKRKEPVHDLIVPLRPYG